MIEYDFLEKLTEEELRVLAVKYGKELDASRCLIEAQSRMIRDLESAYNSLNNAYNCASDRTTWREETRSFLTALQDKYYKPCCDSEN